MALDLSTVFKITADVQGTQAVRQLSDEITKISTASENFTRALGKTATAIKAFITVDAVRRFGESFKQAIDLGDSLNDLSQKIAVPVETLAKFKVAAETSGTSIEALGGALAKFSKAIIEAQSSTGKTAGAFSSLGVSIKDSSGNLKSTETLFLEVSDKFAGLEDSAAKTALAMALFGRSGADLIPMLNLGSEEIKKFSLSISKDFAESADKFNDQLGIMNAQFIQMKVNLAGELLPALNDSIAAFRELFSAGGEKEQGFFSRFLEVMIRGITFLAVELKGLFQTVVAGIAAVTEGLATLGFSGNLTESLKATADSFSEAVAKINESSSKAASLALGIKSPNAPGQNSALKPKGSVPYNPTDQQAGAGEVDSFSKRIAKIRAEADAYGQSNLVKQQAIALAEIEESKLAISDKARVKSAMSGALLARERAKETYELSEYIRKENEVTDTLEMESQFIGKTKVEIENLKEARRLDLEVMEKTKNMTDEGKEAYLEAAKAVKKHREEVRKFNDEQSKTFVTGTRNFMASYVEEISDAAKRAESFWKNSFKGMEDALVNFVKTGKLDFRNLASSIIDDMIRIQIQQSITGPLAKGLGSFLGGGGSSFLTMETARPSAGFVGPMPGSFLGFANGGIMTGQGAVPLKKYASGGIARSPQLALFGEGSMPEAYVPLPDGRRIPVNMQAGGKSGGVTIHNTIDARGADPSVAMRIEEAVKRGAAQGYAMVLNDLNRGGKMARATGRA